LTSHGLHRERERLRLFFSSFLSIVQYLFIYLLIYYYILILVTENLTLEDLLDGSSVVMKMGWERSQRTEHVT
jgi:hypothetical protein